MIHKWYLLFRSSDKAGCNRNSYPKHCHKLW